MSGRPGSRTERGSMSLELAVIAPMLLLLLAMLVAFGRYGQTAGLLEQGARDSARSATQSRSALEMQAAISGVQTEVGGQLPGSCSDSLHAAVDYDSTEARNYFARGTFVTVTYSCNLSLSDLMLPGWQDTTVTRSFTSRLDPNRGVY